MGTIPPARPPEGEVRPTRRPRETIDERDDLPPGAHIPPAPSEEPNDPGRFPGR